MKNLKTLTLVILSFMLFSYVSAPQNASTNSPAKNRIEVYDFHSTHRCMTCNAIESNTLHTLNTYFADEMKAGKVTFQSVNVDLKKNEALARKFKASGTSLFLNVVKDGKETIIDLTNFAFTCGRDQEEFSPKLKARIEEELKKL